MDTPRPGTPGTPVPSTDRPDTLTAASEPVVRTVVADAEPVERTVSVSHGETTPPVIRTVEVQGTAPTAPTAPRTAPAGNGRLVWWIGGGTLGAAALAAGIRAAMQRVVEPEPTPLERITRSEATGPALALAATAATALGLRAVTRGARRTRVERDAPLTAAAVPVVAPRPADATEMTDETELTDEIPARRETVGVPVEAMVLLDILLDPVLAEGRDLPGATALRAQLPLVRTVAEALPAPGDEEAGVDWLPLVVETDEDLARAVPHDCTWPVRGRFVVEGHPFELALVVIDGELGALTVSPVDEDGSMDWDAVPEVQSWPGVQELTFHVDGERRS